MPRSKLRLEKAAAFAHLADWSVHEDGKEEPIGCIYERHAPARPELAWLWSITSLQFWAGRHEVTTSGHAATLDAAKAAFRANWERLKAWSPQSAKS